MSDHHQEPKDLYYHGLFQYQDHDQQLSNLKMSGSPSSAYHSLYQGYDVIPNSYMNSSSFTEYNSLATAFGLSSSISDQDQVFSSIDEGNHAQKQVDSLGYLGGGGNVSDGEVLLTPNSSVSSSSAEAGAEEDSGSKSKKDRQQQQQQPKGSSEDGSGDVILSPKKVSKVGGKKKGEKKEREPRFAFMTKSEVDHLEDGYRWRKYGQKAVKNSPYPRSYYRCTTQKCGVKKRVERSFEDPTTVITTYEGQHNHPIPATLRGSININAAHQHHAFLSSPNYNSLSMYGSAAPTSSSSLGPSFPQEFLFQMATAAQPHVMMRNDGGGGVVYSSSRNGSHGQYQGVSTADQYGLLQDVVPSMFFKQEP